MRPTRINGVPEPENAMQPRTFGPGGCHGVGRRGSVCVCGDLQPHLLGSSTAFAWRTRLTAAWRAPQFKAAQYLRLAEEKGSKTIGNTWYVAFSLFP